MILSALIRKGGLRQAATAIPATAATRDGEKAGSVARVATVAVASRPGPEPFDRDAFEERAGIAEFDGRLSRAEAEQQAYESCIVEWLNRNPSPCDPSTCAWCGKPESSGASIVPFGAEGFGHTWLHPECWPAWHVVRRAEAAKALAEYGVQDATP